jgi:hypothetical protein
MPTQRGGEAGLTVEELLLHNAWSCANPKPNNKMKPAMYKTTTTIIAQKINMDARLIKSDFLASPLVMGTALEAKKWTALVTPLRIGSKTSPPNRFRFCCRTLDKVS